jgi:ABC-2 type transport system permease protein
MASVSRVAEPGPRELSTGRVLWLVARLSLRRSYNRLGNVWRRKPKSGEASATGPSVTGPNVAGPSVAGPSVRTRNATGRKETGGKLLLAFMAIVFAWQTVTTSARLMQRVSRLTEQRAHADVVVLDPVTYHLIRLAAAQQEDVGQPLSAEGKALLERALDRPEFGLSDEAREARGAQIRDTFQSRGLDGFHESTIPEDRFWPSAELWYDGGSPLGVLKPLGVVAFFLALAQILQHVAGSDDDLARVGPGLEWLFTFPVRARALFLARAVAAPFASPLAWVVLLPFYAVVFACAGQGAFGVLSAAAAAIYIALLGGGLRVLLETTLRRALPAIWVSRVQAVLLTLSLLPLAAGYTVAFSPVTSGMLHWASELPSLALYEPLTLPLAWALGGSQAGLAALLALGLLGVWLVASVAVAERMVQGGVTTGAGEHGAVRSRGESGVASRVGFSRGVLLKEWRALLRDRRTRAQAFFGPLLLFGMQFVLNPSLARAITSNARHAATAAFAVSAFSLTTSAFTALASEGPALYWLYTAPVPLGRALLEKLWVRGVVSAVFGLLVFVVAWVTTPSLFVPSLPYAALALVGIALYAVIAVGIGTLGTDVLEPEPRRRVRPGGIYLFMLLAALFAHAIYTPSWWAKLVQLVLSALLAFAVWQKLAERLPFLLDPTEAPPPAISVADGVMAALAFFVLQSLFGFAFGDDEQPPALTLLIAFVSAGSTVALVALFIFRRNRVPDLMRALGLRQAPERRSRSAASIALGVGSGVLAALLALAYLWIARRVPQLASRFDDARQSIDQLDTDARLWMLAVAIVAAPLFEEFIFRGILYKGFRHSVRAPLAALSSALVFALMHPAITALPVFIMAVLAATAYERTRWLMTPVAAHMTYNAIVFGSALLN